MRIVGIVLVINEDRFIEPVVRNIAVFCDEIIVADDYRTRDRTGEIVQHLAREEPKIQYRKILRIGASHEMVAGYADTDTWIFAVDGDEIYDPVGLERFRRRLEAGEFSDWWCIFGNVLNCVRLDEASHEAKGYLAPPSRSMTKLYNFALIRAWDGPCKERLHGGFIRFHQGYDASLRRDLHQEVAWEDADFRCLHTCFLPRSSLDHGDGNLRLNIMDRAAMPWWRRLLKRDRDYVPWKMQKYARGEQVTVDSRNFFSRIPQQGQSGADG